MAIRHELYTECNSFPLIDEYTHTQVLQSECNSPQRWVHTPTHTNTSKAHLVTYTHTHKHITSTHTLTQTRRQKRFIPYQCTYSKRQYETHTHSHLYFCGSWYTHAHVCSQRHTHTHTQIQAHTNPHPYHMQRCSFWEAAWHETTAWIIIVNANMSHL